MTGGVSCAVETCSNNKASIYRIFSVWLSYMRERMSRQQRVYDQRRPVDNRTSVTTGL